MCLQAELATMPRPHRSSLHGVRPLLFVTLALLTISVQPGVGHAEGDPEEERPASLTKLANAAAVYGADVRSNRGQYELAMPLALPPSLGGFAPPLALRYSTGAVGRRHWVGHGWSIPLGAIRRSTADGVPEYDLADTFVYSLAGHGGPLAIEDASADPDVIRFRPVSDAADVLLRYFIQEDRWEATVGDGSVFRYGSAQSARVSDPGGAPPAPRTAEWHLDGAEDPAGRTWTVDYTAEGLALYPSTVEFGGHIGLPQAPHAVHFDYSAVQGAGATVGSYSTNHRYGFEVRLGGLRLDSIRVLAGGEPYRTYDLTYGDAANATNLLVAVATKAHLLGGAPDPQRELALPTIDIGYDSGAPQILDFQPAGGPGLPAALPLFGTNLVIQDGFLPTQAGSHSTWGHGSVGEEKRGFLDLDGNGYPDYVVVDYTGAPAIEAGDCPDKWSTSRAWKVVLRGVDVDQGGALVASEVEWPVPACYPIFDEVQHRTTPIAATIGADPSWADASVTTTIVRLVDFDGDRRPDLLVRESADSWRLFSNTGDAFDLVGVPVAVPPFNTNPPDDGGLSLWVRDDLVPGENPGPLRPVWGLVDLVDLTGDGLPDRVWTGKERSSRLWSPHSLDWIICENDGGAGFLPCVDWPGSQGLDALSQSESFSAVTESTVVLLDMNGDGLRDFVDVAPLESNPPAVVWTPNLGTGFAGQAVTWALPAVPAPPEQAVGWDDSQPRSPSRRQGLPAPWVNGIPVNGGAGETHRFADVNADGLVDLLVARPLEWLAYLNGGDGFVSEGIQMFSVPPDEADDALENPHLQVISLRVNPSQLPGPPPDKAVTTSLAMDIDGDGFLDRLRSRRAHVTEEFAAEYPHFDWDMALGLSRASYRATTLDNGIGGQVLLEYDHATRTARRCGEGPGAFTTRLMAPTPIVTAVSRVDTTRLPGDVQVIRTALDYCGPQSNDGGTSFHGFQVVGRTDTLGVRAQTRYRKTLQISTSPATGKVTTGIIKRRFNPNVLLENGTARYLPMGQ